MTNLYVNAVEEARKIKKEIHVWDMIISQFYEIQLEYRLVK